MNLKEAIDLFLGEYTRATTRRDYAQVLSAFRDYVGPLRPIDDVDKLTLTQYGQHLGKRGLAPATINKYYKTIRILFNWLIRLEVIKNNPATVLKQRRLPSQVSREKAMTEAELARVLDYVKWKPRDHALLLFLADTGCRACGAAGLGESDVDFDTGRATVTEKGDRTRLVAFGTECSILLRAWLLRRKADRGEWVFSTRGQPISSEAISQIVRRACLRVGVRSLGSHSLRHRKGHQLADAKIAPTIAATALGHSDPSTTMRYYYPADWESAEKALRELAHNADAEPKIVRFPFRKVES